MVVRRKKERKKKKEKEEEEEKKKKSSFFYYNKYNNVVIQQINDVQATTFHIRFVQSEGIQWMGRQLKGKNERGLETKIQKHLNKFKTKTVDVN